MSRHPSDTMLMASSILISSGFWELQAITQPPANWADKLTKPRQRRVIATTSDTQRAKLIEQQAWNKAVDRRKAEKRAQKMRGPK